MSSPKVENSICDVLTSNKIIDKVSTKYISLLDNALDTVLNPESTGLAVHKVNVAVINLNGKLLELMTTMISSFSSGEDFTTACQKAFAKFLFSFVSSTLVATEVDDISDAEKQRIRGTTHFMISQLKTAYVGMLCDYNAHVELMAKSKDEASKQKVRIKSKEQMSERIKKHHYSLRERIAHNAKIPCRYGANCTHAKCHFSHDTPHTSPAEVVVRGHAE